MLTHKIIETVAPCILYPYLSILPLVIEKIDW